MRQAQDQACCGSPAEVTPTDANFPAHRTSLSWLALALTPGPGARMAGKLVGEFASPAAIFHASLTVLEASIRPPMAQAIHSRQPLSD